MLLRPSPVPARRSLSYRPALAARGWSWSCSGQKARSRRSWGGEVPALRTGRAALLRGACAPGTHFLLPQHRAAHRDTGREGCAPAAGPFYSWGLLCWPTAAGPPSTELCSVGVPVPAARVRLPPPPPPPPTLGLLLSAPRSRGTCGLFGVFLGDAQATSCPWGRTGTCVGDTFPSWTVLQLGALRLKPQL